MSVLVFSFVCWCGQVVVSSSDFNEKRRKIVLVIHGCVMFCLFARAFGDGVEIVFAALRVPLAVPRLTGLPPVASACHLSLEE